MHSQKEPSLAVGGDQAKQCRSKRSSSTRSRVPGCKGTQVSSAELTSLGLKGDRLYSIVDASGRSLTQREVPVLALIHPDLATDDGITLRVVSKAGLPNLPPLFVPRVSGDPELVHILREPIVVEDQGSQAEMLLAEGGPGLSLAGQASERDPSRAPPHIILQVEEHRVPYEEDSCSDGELIFMETFT